MSKEQELKEMLKLYSKQDLWNKIQEKQAMIYDLEAKLAEKEKQIKTILKENEELVKKHNVYNYGDKIQQDKVYSVVGKALELLINRQNQKVIEQLEKVKKFFLEEHRDEEMDKENSMKVKIEIWQYHNIVDEYESDNIKEVLNWFRKHWRCCFYNGGCAFEVYKNNERLSFFELYELGFED